MKTHKKLEVGNSLNASEDTAYVLIEKLKKKRKNFSRTSGKHQSLP